MQAIEAIRVIFFILSPEIKNYTIITLNYFIIVICFPIVNKQAAGCLLKYVIEIENRPFVPMEPSGGKQRVRMSCAWAQWEKNTCFKNKILLCLDAICYCYYKENNKQALQERVDMKRLDPIEGISALLTRHHLINPRDLSALIHSFNHQDDLTFEDFLLEEGVIERSDLLQTLSEYYRVPQLDVVGEFFDHYLIRLVPKDVLLVHYMIPYMRENDNLWVVAAEPNNPHLPVVLGKYLSHNFNFMVGLPQDILDAIQEYYDQSDTYQPNDIANQHMERSAIDVHTPEQLEQIPQHPGEMDERIPLDLQDTVDDYESH